MKVLVGRSVRLREAMYRNGACHDVILMGMFQDEFEGFDGVNV
jgi:RimJ/RimL family protein N-acetyltransferase